MTLAATPGRERPASRLSRYRCGLVSWITGWSSFTFGSAMLLVAQSGGLSAPGALGREVWHVADAVPPYAKISFGLLFGLLTWLTRRSGRAPVDNLLVHGPVAGLVAALTVLYLVPFDYFSAADTAAGGVHGAPGLAHVAIGALAGLAYAATGLHCRRRQAARS